MMRLSELAAITKGELRGSDVEFASAGIDTRSMKPGDLYIAIRGVRFDGNDFVSQAAQSGAIAAVVERFAEDCSLPQLKVADGRIALGQLGAAWRDRWAGRIVGITGSNGKTTVKEMTAAVLGVAAPVLWTQGNLNNDYGVPLTLMRLGAEHEFGVIEMGANHIGEIAYVSRLVRPDVAIISNAGAAHLEGFGSLEGVARGKGELIGSLADSGIAVLNADDRFFDYWLGLAGERTVLSFGLSEQAVVRADPASISIQLTESGFHTTFDLIYRDGRFPMALALAGRHNVTNALAAAGAALALGLNPEHIRTGLARIAPVPGRLEPVRGQRGSVIINDAYNANPSSFGAALGVLADMPRRGWVAMGALGELGDTSPELHAEMGQQAKALGIERLFTVGPNADHAAAAFGEGAVHCQSHEEMIERIAPGLADGVALLVKGSRSQKMERVVEALRASSPTETQTSLEQGHPAMGTDNRTKGETCS